MNTRYIFSGIVLLLCCFCVSLFVGVYEHDEFHTHHFFIKHRPILKWYFWSPQGMTDVQLRDLSGDLQAEQRYFDEFVGERVYR